ncbi:MAG: PKD domain-containing protein [Candidatus Bipolaricaulia bacterium]
MRKIQQLLGFMLILLLIPLSAHAQEAQITVESVTAHPAEEVMIAISASDIPAPGIAAIQGSISFDPQVVELEDLIFSDQFNIEVKNIQTASVKFAATLTADHQPITGGTLLQLKVKAVGRPGDESEIDLTLEVLSDLDYKDIPYKITDGTFTIKAVNRPPVADFTFSPAEPTTDDTVQFMDRSHDPDGKIVGWRWEFGDGAAASVQTPSHKYTAPGSYTIRLTVTDNEGATATATKEILVIPAVTEPTVICYPNPARDHVTFRYYLPRGTKRAELLVFDLVGAEVFSHELDVDKIEFRWDLKDNLGDPLPNGLYFFFVQGIDRQDRPIRSKIGKLVIQR